jgi:nitroreductase
MLGLGLILSQFIQEDKSMILPAIQERRSVREFQTTEVSGDLIQELILAAQFAPTGMNTRAVEFVVLRSPEVKAKLFALLEPKQPFVKEAPVVIIPIADTRKSVTAVADLAIASSFIMIQAVASGLGSVWKHIAPEAVPDVIKAFNLPPEFTLINALPLGYPGKNLPPHQEREFSAAKIHFEQW